MTPLELVGFFVLLVVVGVVCYRAGWLSAHSYLEASLAVNKISSSAADSAQAQARALDKLTDAVSSSDKHRTEDTERINARQQAVEESFLALRQGFERAGLARAPRSGPGPQRGESPESD